MIDAVDVKILNILQSDARTPNAEIARRVKMAPSGVLERVRKLEERGIIRGYQAQLNAKALGLGLVAFVFVRAEGTWSDIGVSDQLAAIPEVQEIHHVAGDDCFLVKIRTENTDTLGKLLRERFATIPMIRSTRTTIVLQTEKEVSTIPLVQLPEEEVSRGE
jgi:Lrp/AsnC family transcriptional regulator, leucine-responsive regulatory protein